VDTLATTPEPPYYAVIFTSERHAEPDDGYEDTAARMLELASRQPGFLGVESARERLGLTVCYWSDLDAIAAWKAETEHVAAQQAGRERWYERYSVRVALVERAYAFEARRDG